MVHSDTKINTGQFETYFSSGKINPLGGAGDGKYGKTF